MVRGVRVEHLRAQHVRGVVARVGPINELFDHVDLYLSSSNVALSGASIEVNTQETDLLKLASQEQRGDAEELNPIAHALFDRCDRRSRLGAQPARSVEDRY